MPLKGPAKREYARQYYLKNKKSVIEKTKAYHLAHPEVQLRSHKNRLLRDHSLTHEEYEVLLKDQEGLCSICKRKDTRALSIDHDHSCCAGEKSCSLCTRGLLCNDCNKKLAVVEDEIFIQKALEYLERWKR